MRMTQAEGHKEARCDLHVKETHYIKGQQKCEI